MGTNGHPAVATNLSLTKFLFLIPHQDDAATLVKIRGAGANISRGFFNDYDADGARDPQPQERIQFLQADADLPAPGMPSVSSGGIAAARHVVQLSANYRSRLDEVTSELKRRISDAADLIVLDGAERAPRYTSAEMHNYAYKPAVSRLSGRVARNAIIIPMSKTSAWWEKTALQRHPYFYPHHDAATGGPVKGHAQAAEAGIKTIFRKLYHNPDGYQRAGEFDFVTYFECADEHVPVFDEICRGLRDTSQNPEWKYVVEGPEWRGKRVLRW
jgi:hypothetical protein